MNYGIFTKFGALVIKFNATTFDMAFGIMDYILSKHPELDNENLTLCKMD